MRQASLQSSSPIRNQETCGFIQSSPRQPSTRIYPTLVLLVVTCLVTFSSAQPHYRGIASLGMKVKDSLLQRPSTRRQQRSQRDAQGQSILNSTTTTTWRRVGWLVQVVVLAGVTYAFYAYLGNQSRRRVKRDADDEEGASDELEGLVVAADDMHGFLKCVEQTHCR
jgi:hypothetical protein